DKARTPVDLPPILAPGAVRPPAVSLLMEHVKDGEPAPNFYRASAESIAYCMLGGDAFAHANDARLASAIERRIEAAIEPGTSLDAKLVLCPARQGDPAECGRLLQARSCPRLKSRSAPHSCHTASFDRAAELAVSFSMLPFRFADAADPFHQKCVEDLRLGLSGPEGHQSRHSQRRDLRSARP